jgi:phosphatidylglycerol:prolipoprotein diacylglycerol transferase
MQQVLFRIPIHTQWTPDGVPIYGFGMMLFLAFLICTWVAGRRAETQGIPREKIQDLVIWLFLGGLLGARVVYLVHAQDFKTVLDFLRQLPLIWEGGIVLYGAVLGALAAYCVAYWFIFRNQGVSTLKLADILAPSIALGLCLGRIGCFLNGCCYGQVACPDCAVSPVHFPLSAPAREALVMEGWQTSAGFTYAVPQLSHSGVTVGQVSRDSAAWQAGLRPGNVIEKANGRDTPTPVDLSEVLGSLRGWPRGKKDVTLTVGGKNLPPFIPLTLGLYPTQLYESVSMFLLFLFLSAVYPWRGRDGLVVSLLMICYGTHRYLNELLRGDPRPVGFERYSSIILIAGGIVLLLLWWSKTSKAQAPTTGELRMA